MEIGYFHWRFSYTNRQWKLVSTGGYVTPTASELSVINSPLLPPDSELYARSQLPLEAILEVQISQKYKGGGFGLHFLEEGG